MARKKGIHKKHKRTRTKQISISKDIAPLVLKGAKVGGSAGYAFGKKHLTKANAQKVQQKVSSLISKLKEVKANLKKKKSEKKYARVTMSIIR